MNFLKTFLVALLLPQLAFAGLAPIAIPSGTTIQFLNSGLKTLGIGHIDATGKLTSSAVDLSGADTTNTLPAARYAAFLGDSGSGGTQGAVPAPAAATAEQGYVLGAGGSFVLNDTSKPAVAPFNYLTQALSFSGNQKMQNVLMVQNGGNTYAVVGGGTTKTVSIYNVTNQAAPVLRGTINLLGTYGVCGSSASWPYVYVPASGGRTLTVLNISNPNSPTVTGTYSWAANTTSIYACAYANGLVFMAGQSRGLGILDVGNGVSGGTPAAPVLAFDEGSLNGVGQICNATNSCKSFGVAVDAANSIAYVTTFSTATPWTYRQLKAYSYASSITSPTLLQNLAMPANTKALAVSLDLVKHTAYVGDANQNLYDVVDITNVATGGMSNLSTFAPSGGRVVQAQFAPIPSLTSSLVYSPGSSASLAGAIDVWDLSNRSSPVLVNTITGPLVPDIFGGIAFDPRGGYIYAGAYGNGTSGSALDVFSTVDETATVGAMTADTASIKSFTTAGVVHNSSSGALSSSAVSLTADVSGLLPNANLANPSTTVNGQTCTLGSTCSITVGTGNVTGPGSSTVGHVALFNNTTGTLLSDSGLTLAGTNTGDVTLGTTNGLSLSGQALSLQAATNSVPGALTAADHTTFAAKFNTPSGTTTQYVRGDGTLATLDTSVVPENGNLYFTNARTIGSTLTGYTSGAGTVSSADSVLSAIQKLNGNTSAISAGAITSMTGDVTGSGPGAAATTLATVNSTPGSYGSATSVATVTTNGKGLVTASGSASIQIAESQVTNLTTDLAGKQATGNYMTSVTGDATGSGPGATALTLATVNSTPGSYGSATAVPTLTTNGKGLVTASGSTSIQIAESQVTNLTTDLAGKQATGNYLTALTGDATASGPGSAAITFATVNSTPGSYGGATAVPTITTNGKGLVTASGSASIQIAESQVTNLTTDLAGKQATGNYITGITGDLVATGPGSVTGTIQASAVTNSKMANMANNTVKGNVSGVSAAPSDLTATQLTTLVNAFTSSLSGAVPASGGGTTNFLRADGTFAAPPGGSSTLAVATKTTTYTLTNSDDVILCNGTFTITTQSAATATKKPYRIKNIGTGTCTISAADNIDGAGTLVISTQYAGVEIIPDGTTWWGF